MLQYLNLLPIFNLKNQINNKLIIKIFDITSPTLDAKKSN
jgi:hypothetical protein